MHLAYEREFWELVETARKRGSSTDPEIRQQLAWAYSQVEIMRFSGLRALAQLAQGRQPGPEASINKLFWSEYHKKLGEIAMDIEGTDAPDPARRATTATRPLAGRTSSWPAGPAPSTPAPTRSSATSSPSAPWACPRSRGCGRDGRWQRDGDDRDAGRPRTPGTRAAAAAAARQLITPERLRDFFAPRSIALVGASETSGWARFIVAASSAVGYSGPLLPVHPRHDKIFGRPAVRTLRDLPEPADLAFILAPTEAVATVIEDAAAGGVRNAVVLASGYREAGADGMELEDSLIAAAASHGIVLLGPELPRLPQHRGQGRPVRPDRAAAAHRRPGRDRAAERRAGQRAARPSPGRTRSASAPSRASATRR